jgi:pentatricopeptide repeat protein
MLGNALVEMYVKCGILATAQQVHEELPSRNIVSWSALIAGYAQRGEGHSALNCFEQMQSEGIRANAVTFICILKACGSVGAIDTGEKIHEEIIGRCLLDKEDIVLGNALVDMYAKCGMLSKAAQVLESLPMRNVVSWNALISGYAEQGEGSEALECFEKMQKEEGISPNEVTFLSVLTACSYAGLLEQAESLYGDMGTKYGVAPKLEHHTCMVTMLGSGGHFEKAIAVINAMPSCDDPEIWLVLLGACRKWGNVELGKLAFDHVVRADDACGAAYVLMANVFAACGMQEDASKVEAMRAKQSRISARKCSVA